MNNDEFWSSVYSGVDDGRPPARFAVLRLALLFGTAAIALALVIPPLVGIPDGDAERLDLDYTTTASVPGTRDYTIHRSVLQQPGGGVCIIDAKGRRSGNCE